MIPSGDTMARPGAGRLLMLLGLLLLMLNLTGLFHYRTIDPKQSGLKENDPTPLSEADFWQRSKKLTDESPEAFAKRLTALVESRIIQVSSSRTKPTLTENWILWGVSHYLGFYEWIDTQKAIRLGGGLCSQHAIVFNNILEQNGIPSRILALDGHVLNEVRYRGEWHVHDPSFNVLFSRSFEALHQDGERVYDTYTQAGLSPFDANLLRQAFQHPVENPYFDTSRDYSAKRHLAEKLSVWLIWLTPILLILSGWMLEKKTRLRA
ncbi:MAG: hypothetical protein HQL52_15675 [Magnetococcales bacterium]|nr:hypothetical protein [Magnetococcales bacterium]